MSGPDIYHSAAQTSYLIAVPKQLPTPTHDLILTRHFRGYSQTTSAIALDSVSQTLGIMKEVIIHPSLFTELKESAVPKPDASQVVIKVIVSGINPKDWKVSHLIKTRHRLDRC